MNFDHGIQFKDRNFANGVSPFIAKKTSNANAVRFQDY